MRLTAQQSERCRVTTSRPRVNESHLHRGFTSSPALLGRLCFKSVSIVVTTSVSACRGTNRGDDELRPRGDLHAGDDRGATSRAFLLCPQITSSRAAICVFELDRRCAFHRPRARAASRGRRSRRSRRNRTSILMLFYVVWVRYRLGAVVIVGILREAVTRDVPLRFLLCRSSSPQ